MDINDPGNPDPHKCVTALFRHRMMSARRSCDACRGARVAKAGAMWRHFPLAFVLVLFATAFPPGAFAQAEVPRGSKTSHEIAWAAANGLVAGIAAGVLRRLNGDNFWEGFSQGAIGGLVHYGGKRLSAVDSDFAQPLARQLGSLGTSLIEDAAREDSAVLRVRVLLGPAHLSIDAKAGFTWAVNLRDLATIVVATLHPDLTLLWHDSFVRGVPVFRAHDGLLRDRRRTGIALGGVILIEPIARYEQRPFLAHEMVHVIQNDFFTHLLELPLESRVLRAVTGNSKDPLPHVEIGIVLPATTWLLHALAPDQTLFGPFESEAEFIEARATPRTRTFDPRLLGARAWR